MDWEEIWTCCCGCCLLVAVVFAIIGCLVAAIYISSLLGII